MNMYSFFKHSQVQKSKFNLSQNQFSSRTNAWACLNIDFGIVKQFSNWFIETQEAQRFAHFSTHEEQFLNLNKRNNQQMRSREENNTIYTSCGQNAWNLGWEWQLTEKITGFKSLV